MNLLQKTTERHKFHFQRMDGPNRSAPLILIMALVIGFIFRLRMYIQERSLWLDAANLANNIVKKGYTELWKLLDGNQSAPVGFLFASKFVGAIFDYSEASLLFLPFLFGIGALFLFLFFTVDVLGAKVAPIAFLPFAFCSTAIYYSGEFKQYSGDLFFSVLILFITNKILQERHKISWVIIFGIVGLISAWFSHASLIVLAGTGIALFLNEIKHKEPKFIAFLAITGLVICVHFIALYFLQIRHATPASMFSIWQEGFAPVNLFAAHSYKWWFERTVGYAMYPLGFQAYGMWLSLLALSVGIGVLSFDETRRAFFQSLLFPIILLVGLSALQLYPITTGKYDIYSRFVLFTIPIALIFVAIGINRIAKLFPAPLLALAFLGILLVYPSIKHMVSWPDYMKQEMKPLVAHLRKNLSPNDLIYVYHYSIPAFEFYTRHEPISFVKGTTFNPIELPKELAVLPSDKRIWTVISHDASKNREIIERVFESRNASISVKNFPGNCWLILSIPHTERK